MLIIAHDGPAVNLSSAHVPPSLIGFWQKIVSLSDQRGYCWARTATLASWWPSKRDGKETVAASTVWRWLRKLEAAGCVRIVPVPGSHERRVYPVFFRPRLKRNCTPVASKKNRSLLLSESPKGEETTTTPPTAAQPNEPKAEPSPAVLAAASSLREGTGGEIPEAIARHEVQANRLSLADVRAIVAAYQERRASVRNVVGWVRDACRKRYKPGEGPGVRLPANHPANRDSRAASLAAERERARRLVPVIVPPVSLPPIETLCGPAAKFAAMRERG